MESPLYTIEELETHSGVSVRNIRYYTAQGLLPPPDARGRYALYSDEHLARLRLIRRRVDAFIPLKTIKQELEALSYAQVLERLAAPPAVRERNLPALDNRSEPPARERKGHNSATEYIARVLAGQRDDLAEAEDSIPPLAGQAPPASRAAPAPMAPGGAPEPSPPPVVAAESVQDEWEAIQTWQHIPLLPGVELRVREPIPPDVRLLVDQLLAFARSLREPKP